MDKTQLVATVKSLFEMTGHRVQTSVRINHREIDVVAEERTGLVRKTILIECADYAGTVGVDKLQPDLLKLNSARQTLDARAIVMHVAARGYSQDAKGYALEHGIPLETPDSLELKLVNFEPYVQAVSKEDLRPILMREYQPTKIHPDGKPHDARPALTYLEEWLSGGGRWLTILGDYGVGKSWTLRRLLYRLMERYEDNPLVEPLPFFISLQRFTKAFDFQNLILKTFEQYRLVGTSYTAFEYLARRGRILFLLDSFDEMAQSLGRDILRENLKELLGVVSLGCRAIMTSRPTYFESRAERLVVVEKDGQIHWHPLDRQSFDHHSSVARAIQDRLGQSQFARLNDLTTTQRKALFKVVLADKPSALDRLNQLYSRFQELESISQRAVIARLLTTVAETLATNTKTVTIDGYDLIPADLQKLNQSKIFESVVYNLLHRDLNIGSLNASDRLKFLRSLAVLIQRRNRDLFATPEEIRNLVERLFRDYFRRTDAPQQMIENYYRTCRRHSGLTTEGQFRDTSGHIDIPVDENDNESNIGFSHNSLREYLVADALTDFITRGTDYPDLSEISTTDVIGDFVVDISTYQPELLAGVRDALSNSTDPKMRQILFKLALRFIHRDASNVSLLLGDVPAIDRLDLSRADMSGLALRGASFRESELFETDMRKSDLRATRFEQAIIYRVLLDGALVTDADFTRCELDSIYVMDDLEANTSRVLAGREARQWLFTKGAKVHPTSDLNTLLGLPWYEAAREVTRTLERRLAGTHQDASLSKGTKSTHRVFAREFVNFLVKTNVLRRLKKSDSGPGYIVKVADDKRGLISDFSQKGIIDTSLKPFFDRYLNKKE